MLNKQPTEGPHMHHSNRGFTKTELIIVIAVVLGVIVLACAGSLGLGILLPSLGAARQAARQLKDSSQVRGVLQGMMLYSQNNGGRYPLPSMLDTGNMTVPAQGTAKDTSANIYSLLLWNGLATTELFVSPVETGNVAVYSGYEYSQPRATVKPREAMWDPAFVADFTGSGPGGISYVHMLPGGTHAPAWGDTFDSRQALISNRGPRVDAVSYDAAGAISNINANPQSITYNFHRPNTWSGNVGYNDNHVKFELTMTPTTYSHTPGAGRGDVLFYDEPDDVIGTNNFLSMFITAGDANKDFKSIWD